MSDRIDEQRITTEHYAYVFEQCLRGVALHPQREKIECYKAILINAGIPGANGNDEEQDYFLNLVNTLSPVHIRLISALHAASKIPHNGPKNGQTIRNFMGDVDGDILMSAAAELYQLQFTRTQATSLPFDADFSQLGARLTPIARKFIEFCTISS